MKKRIRQDLVSLGHELLKIRDTDEIAALQEQARDLYEKLTVLRYAQERLDNATPLTTSSAVEEAMEVALKHVEGVYESNPSNEREDEFPDREDDEMTLPGISTIQQMIPEMDTETQLEEIKTTPKLWKNDMQDVAADYDNLPKFTRKEAPKETPKPAQTANVIQPDEPAAVEKLPDAPAASTGNTTLLKVGFNDRIGFVKHLYNGDQKAYEDMLKKLSHMNGADAAEAYVTKNLAIVNDWSSKQPHVDRLVGLIKAQF